MIYQPKQYHKLEMLCFGYALGAKVTVALQENQKWTAKKSGKYYTLTRKGTSVTLRLTGAALNNLFRECAK